MYLFVLFSSLTEREDWRVCVCVLRETVRHERREEKMYNIISDGVYYVYAL